MERIQLISMLEYALGYVLGAITALIPGFHINTLSLLIYKTSITKQLTSAHAILLTAIISSSLFSYLAILLWKTADNEEIYASNLANIFAAKGLHQKYLEISFFSTSFTLLLFSITFPFFSIIYKNIYQFLIKISPWILSIILLRMIIKGNLYLISASSFLGYLSFKTSININMLLTAIFFGMFALPNVMALSSITLPSSKKPKKEKAIKGLMKASFAGYISSFITSFIPAISPLVIGSMFLAYIKPPKQIIAFIASLSFSDMLFSLFTLPITNNSRNGSGVFLHALKPLTFKDIIMTIIITAVSIYFTYKLSIKISSSQWYRRLSFLKYFALTIIPYLIYSQGIKILLILIPSALLGLYTIKNKENPVDMLAVLITPTLISMIFS